MQPWLTQDKMPQIATKEEQYEFGDKVSFSRFELWILWIQISKSIFLGMFEFSYQIFNPSSNNFFFCLLLLALQAESQQSLYYCKVSVVLLFVCTIVFFRIKSTFSLNFHGTYTVFHLINSFNLIDFEDYQYPF